MVLCSHNSSSKARKRKSRRTLPRSRTPKPPFPNRDLPILSLPSGRPADGIRVRYVSNTAVRDAGSRRQVEPVDHLPPSFQFRHNSLSDPSYSSTIRNWSFGPDDKPARNLPREARNFRVSSRFLARVGLSLQTGRDSVKSRKIRGFQAFWRGSGRA